MNEVKQKFMVTFGGYYVTVAGSAEEARTSVPDLKNVLPPMDAYIVKVEPMGYC